MADFNNELDVIDDLLDYGRHKNARGRVIKKSVQRFTDDLETAFTAVTLFTPFSTRDASIVANMLKKFDPELRYMAPEPAVLGYLVHREVRDKGRQMASPDLLRAAVASTLEQYRRISDDTTVCGYAVIRYSTLYALLDSQPITLTY